jgi:hypothetical protein
VTQFRGQPMRPQRRINVCFANSVGSIERT